MEPLFSTFTSIMLRANLLLGVSGLLFFLLRKASAAVRHAYIAAALFAALLLPVATVLPDMPVLPVAADELPRVETAVDSSLDPLSGSTFFQQAAAGQSVADDAGKVSSEAILFLSIENALIIIWCTGFIAVLVHVLRQYLLWYRIMAATKPAGKAVLTVLDEVCDSFRIRNNVTVRTSDTLHVPCIYGLFKACIVLPARARGWSQTHMRRVLEHELAHFIRRDLFTQLIANIAVAVYWFNPLVWLAAAGMLRERETACDNMVLNHGSRPSEYAAALLHSFKGSRQRLSLVTGMFSGRLHLAERVAGILSSERNRGPLRRSTLLLLCAIFCTLAVAGATVTSADPPGFQAASESTENEQVRKPTVTLLNTDALRPGDPVFFEVIDHAGINKADATFLDQSVRFTRLGSRMVGIAAVPLHQQPGSYGMEARFATEGEKQVSAELAVTIAEESRFHQNPDCPSTTYENLIHSLNLEPQPLQSLQFVEPLQGRITREFVSSVDPKSGTKRNHLGIDVKAQEGSSIAAMSKGTVVFAGRSDGYGNTVIVDHGGGLMSFYAHMSEISVETGAVLDVGDTLGKVGSTGRSARPHLHYVLIVNGLACDPYRLPESVKA